MTKEKASKWIKNRLKENNWYGVLWSGHFGQYFIINEIPNDNRDSLESIVYSSIYEEYYYKYDHKTIIRWDFPYNKVKWNSLVRLIKEFLNRSKNER